MLRSAGGPPPISTTRAPRSKWSRPSIVRRDMGAKPPLTVFTTFYKVDRRHLDQAIGTTLAQSFGDFEFLIINDGDPAESERIIATFRDQRIRIINQTRQGIARSRERGLAEARGELFAMIDADDYCEPGRFEKQIAFLREHRDHVLAGSALRLVDADSNVVGFRKYPEHDDEIKRTLLRMNCIAQPSTMARRDSLIAAGGYTAEFPWAEDYDLWLRLARHGKFYNFPEALISYRIHEESGKNLRLKIALRDKIGRASCRERV